MHVRRGARFYLVFNRWPRFEYQAPANRSSGPDDRDGPPTPRPTNPDPHPLPPFFRLTPSIYRLFSTRGEWPSSLYGSRTYGTPPLNPKLINRKRRTFVHFFCFLFDTLKNFRSRDSCNVGCVFFFPAGLFFLLLGLFLVSIFLFSTMKRSNFRFFVCL